MTSGRPPGEGGGVLGDGLVPVFGVEDGRETRGSNHASRG